MELASAAMELDPLCFEAFYARARAKRENKQYQSAVVDIMEALKLAPNNTELKRLLVRVKEECRQHERFVFTSYLFSNTFEIHVFWLTETQSDIMIKVLRL